MLQNVLSETRDTEVWMRWFQISNARESIWPSPSQHLPFEQSFTRYGDTDFYIIFISAVNLLILSTTQLNCQLSNALSI